MIYFKRKEENTLLQEADNILRDANKAEKGIINTLKKIKEIHETDNPQNDYQKNTSETNP